MNAIRTVRGPLAPDSLGPTMTHEHLLWDQQCWWRGDPDELSLREFVHSKVSIENLGQIYYHAHLHLDNIQQWSVELAITEAMHYKKAGGGTIVDVTPIGVGRDPRAILAISQATNLNIVMGSGFYISNSQTQDVKEEAKEAVADRIIREFTEGVGETGIWPGVIGEIGVSDIHNENELKTLKAAAIAQKRLGAPLYIHPPIFETAALSILDVVEKEGGDLTRVVMCHCDPTLDHPSYHDSIAKRGAYIEFDQFGMEFVGVEGYFLPRDIERIRAIRKQIELGNIKHILVSQDVCFKICLVSFGGWGYAHILRDIVPLMRRDGFSEAELREILVENPKRLLPFELDKH